MNLVGMLPHFDASWHTEVANDEDSKDDGPYWTYPFDNEGNANILTPPAYVDALLDFDPYASTRATTEYFASPFTDQTVALPVPLYAEYPIASASSLADSSLNTFDAAPNGFVESELVARYLNLSPPQPCHALASVCPAETRDAPAAASSTLHPYQHYSLPDDIGEEITALCTSDITEIALTPQVSPRPPDLHTQLAKDPGSSGLSAVNTPAASSVTTNGSPGPTCTSHTNLSIYDTYSGRRIGIVPADQCSLAEPAPPRRKLKRTTVVACVFCRGRKIACGGPVHGASDNTCRQCRRRKLVCSYPPRIRARRGSEQCSFDPIQYPGPPSCAE